MISLLFVCHGNICRSPMAEFIMKDLVRKAGLESEFYIASGATSTEEIGNDIYPPAKEELRRRGVTFSSRQAVQVTKSDYDKYDLILIMDSYNKRNIMRIFGNDAENKVHKLLEYAGRADDVSDPWYSDRFDVAFEDIYSGCKGLLEKLTEIRG